MHRWISHFAKDPDEAFPGTGNLKSRDEELRRLLETPRARYSFIESHCSKFGVERICRVLGISRSGYYARRGRGPSRHKCEDAVLLERIKESYVRGREVYVNPRITKDLKATGMKCGRRRVARPMRFIGLRAKTKRRFRITTDSRHKLPVAPNLLERNFTAEAPDRVWVSDITCVWTTERWLYLLAIPDIYSRKIVGWSTGLRLTEVLAVEALKQAVRRRMPNKGLLF